MLKFLTSLALGATILAPHASAAPLQGAAPMDHDGAGAGAAALHCPRSQSVASAAAAQLTPDEASAQLISILNDAKRFQLDDLDSPTEEMLDWPWEEEDTTRAQQIRITLGFATHILERWASATHLLPKIMELLIGQGSAKLELVAKAFDLLSHHCQTSETYIELLQALTEQREEAKPREGELHALERLIETFQARGKDESERRFPSKTIERVRRTLNPVGALLRGLANETDGMSFTRHHMDRAAAGLLEVPLEDEEEVVRLTVSFYAAREYRWDNESLVVPKPMLDLLNFMPRYPAAHLRNVVAVFSLLADDVLGASREVSLTRILCHHDPEQLRGHLQYLRACTDPDTRWIDPEIKRRTFTLIVSPT